MDQNIKKLKQELKARITKRNKKIVQEAVLAEKSYGDIAKEHGISRARVKQILMSYGVKVPMKKGTGKWKTMVKRVKQVRK